MTKKSKESISEEYYPISMEILQSFPKYRPKVDLFIFNEEISQLYPVAKKDVRLTNEQLENIHDSCKAGVLFVSRSDQHIYVDLIAKQAELVLFNTHLLEAEIVQILFQALQMRLENLIEQPLPLVYEALYKDVMVFTEYLWNDPQRLEAFIPKIETTEFKIASQSITTLIIGCWMFLQIHKAENRRLFDRLAMGLILHNIGLSKIPAHVVYKTTALNREELEKYQGHVRQSANLLHKFGISHSATIQTVLEHHERLDGSGYPVKLTGGSISDNGCIAMVASAFSELIVPKHGVPRVTTLEAVKKLAKDNAFPVGYTAILLQAYAEKRFPNI